MLTAFQLHVQRWKDCQLCPLGQVRQHIVIAKGKIPCTVLYLGEAPGDSEDVIGRPFEGPAGQLLDQIVERSIDQTKYRLAFTNLVCCFPREEKRAGTNEPPKEAIKACAPRLKEFVRLAKPRLIVRVGALATKWVGGQAVFMNPGDGESLPWLNGRPLLFCDITHPAAILRANTAHQGLMKQKCIVALTSAIEDLEAANGCNG